MNTNNLFFFILVGGYGTRLKSRVKHLPKPMLLVNDEPFLNYKIKHIRYYFKSSPIYLLSHYLSNVIEDFYKESKDIEIIKENIPLGTGGAIKNAMCQINLSSKSRLVVINGDTYDKINYEKLISEKDDINLVCRREINCDKYNTINMSEDGYVKYFNKKSNGLKNKYINAGSYYFNNLNFFNKIDCESFSLESEFIKKANNLHIKAFKYEGPFLDIGTPNDLYKIEDMVNKYG